jgi:hypothetical protein
MLFHLFAFSMMAAFISLVSGYLCEKNALNNLADLFFLSGTFLLLITHISAFLAFFLHAAKSISANIRHYFSKTESIRRRLLYRQIRQIHLEQLQRFKIQQLHYRCEHRRKRLNRLNDKKHVRLLSKAIYQSLTLARNKISGSTYKSLKKDLHKNYRTENVEGLIKLHLEITSNR